MSGGPSGVGRTGGGTKKKFGKNLNKLTQATSAPPVPSSSGSGSSSLPFTFRGSSSSRNGLLLLSTKSKSSSTPANPPVGSPVLAPLGIAKNAHDKLLQSAGSRAEEGKGGQKITVAAWGIGEKKDDEQPSSAVAEKSEPPPLELNKQQRGPPSAAAHPSPWRIDDIDKKPEVGLDHHQRYGEQQRPSYQESRSYQEPRRPSYHNSYDQHQQRPYQEPRRAYSERRPYQEPRSYNTGDYYRNAEPMSNRYERNGESAPPNRFERSGESSVSGRFENRNYERRSVQSLRPNTAPAPRDRFSSSSSAPPDRFSNVRETTAPAPPPPDRFAAPQPAPPRDRFADIAQNVEKMDLKDETADSPKKILTKLSDSSADQNNTQSEEKPNKVVEPTTLQSPAEGENMKEYMTKLAKERAEKRRLEEEERMAAQKERAAIRLRELEEKRLKKRKEQLHVISEERKELSRPSRQVILEPLGKSAAKQTDTIPEGESSSSSLKPLSKSNTNEEKKKDFRTLYNPDRSFSSLVGGKGASNANNKEESQRVDAEKSTDRDPTSTATSAPHDGKQSTGEKTETKNKDDTVKPLMVKLNDVDDDDELGRGTEPTRERKNERRAISMLFDPNSGSMVAATVKKTKQKGPTKRSEETDKKISRRPNGAASAAEGSDTKQTRVPRGKGSTKKDESIALQQKNKRRKNPRKRIPRTCGVMYKIDKVGNYMNIDGCEPDNGYGAHRVPGGKVKNPGAHTKLLKKEEEKETTTTVQPSGFNGDATTTVATDGFSFRNDPGFIQHQTNFESQQQKILEDAWASLVENDDDKEEKQQQHSDGHAKDSDEVPPSKSGDDEYAAALSISPSMIGLNFDTTDNNMGSVLLPPAVKATTANKSQDDGPIDLASFALDAASSTPANPFTTLGVTSAGLWGAGTSAATSTTTYGDLSALTGWAPTPFGTAETDAATTTAGTTGLNGSSSQASKLHLWGSSAFSSEDENKGN